MNDVIKGILYNRDETVDYVIDDDKLDGILNEYINISKLELEIKNIENLLNS